MKYAYVIACSFFLIPAAFPLQAKAPQMISIPAGSFQMGSCKNSQALAEENKKRAFLGQAPMPSNCGTTDTDASDDETPKHKVSIQAFKLGKTEVTLGEFKAFIASSGRTDLVDDVFMKHNNSGDDAPVTIVSWNDANAYIKWLNKTYGGGYRLPSEAEWEYACKAGKNTTYCGSNNADDVAWYDVNSDFQQRPVAQKQPNNFGLYDMSGNAWEWTADCWHNSYDGAPSNHVAWTDSCMNDGRVIRGGSWYHSRVILSPSAAELRASNRSYYGQDFRHSNLGIGFRVAQDAQ